MGTSSKSMDSKSMDSKSRDSKIRVSVVIPTYNRCAQLMRVIDALREQTFPMAHFETVVVSDGSTDGTNEYLQTVETPFCLVHVVQENAGVAAARNAGVEHASGELILFIDDDVVPTPSLLAEHVETHRRHAGADERTLVVMGPMLTPADFALLPWVDWEQSMLMKQYDDMAEGRWEPTARQFYTGNASLPRADILAVGGFDTTFRRAEDVELAYRLAERGARFLFNGGAVGYHYASRTFASWLRTPYAYGRNDVIFTREGGQSWLLPTVMREFQTRHPAIRQMTRLFLSRPLPSSALIGLLRLMATLASAMGASRVSDYAYSGIFNLRYYQGITDELGGRRIFLQHVDELRDAARTAHTVQFEGK